MRSSKRLLFLCSVVVSLIAYQEGVFANRITAEDCSWTPVGGMGIAQDANDASDAAEESCNDHNCGERCAEMTTYYPECEEYVEPPASGPYDCNADFIQFSGGYYYYGAQGYCECPYDVIIN